MKRTSPGFDASSQKADWNGYIRGYRVYIERDDGKESGNYYIVQGYIGVIRVISRDTADWNGLLLQRKASLLRGRCLYRLEATGHFLWVLNSASQTPLRFSMAPAKSPFISSSKPAISGHEAS